MPGGSIVVYSLKTCGDFWWAKVCVLLKSIIATALIGLISISSVLNSELMLLVQALIVGVPTGLCFYFLFIEYGWRNHFIIPTGDLTIEEAVTQLKASTADDGRGV